MTQWKEPAIVPTFGGTQLFNLVQLIGPGDWVRNGWITAPAAENAGRMYFGLRRNAQVAAGYVEELLGDFPGFHDLVDPTTAKRTRGFEMRDFCYNVIAAGACSYAWGIHDYFTLNDPTTLVGLGFEHGPDFILKTFLKDMVGNVLPVRVVHQVVTAALANVPHELAITVDGWTKTIKWYIDGIVVDSYTPIVPVDGIGGTNTVPGQNNVVMQSFKFRGFVPALGDMTIFRYGGGLTNPLLSLVEYP